MNNVPKKKEKVNRSQFVTYLDKKKKKKDMTFALLGVGITDYGIAYNAQVEGEKWIIEDNARNDHSSNQKQGSVSQKIYKNDPCFEFVEKGRDALNYKTHILDIDRWNGTTEGTYPATLSDGKVVITQYMGENAMIEYDLYYDGDSKKGTVTFTAGVPTFTVSAD